MAVGQVAPALHRATLDSDCRRMIHEVPNRVAPRRVLASIAPDELDSAMRPRTMRKSTWPNVAIIF